MPSIIDIKKGKTSIFGLERDVFEMLFNHTIARRKKKYVKALEDGYMQYDDFIKTTSDAEVPYPLFFLDKESVQGVILAYERRVYFGVSKDQMSIASRGEVVLGDISLILKDITRKQSFIKQYITGSNEITGMFGKSKQDVAQHASALRSMLDYDLEKVKQLSKEKTYEMLNRGLANRNVFISLYAHHYTPQTVEKELQFSGIAINDKKCPYLFIKAGDNDSRIEPWGRRIFTAALLLSCLCSGDCGPLTMDGKSGELTDDKHYIFAEEFLMPASVFKHEAISSYEDIGSISSKYSVSPAAVVMRAFRLHMIDELMKDEYLQRLHEQWEKVTRKKGGGIPLGLEKAINRYNNPAVVSMIVGKQKSGDITLQEAKNLLCYKKGDAFNLEVFDSYA